MNVFIQIPRKHVSLHFLPSCIHVAIRQQQTAIPAADSCHKIQAFAHQLQGSTDQHLVL